MTGVGIIAFVDVVTNCSVVVSFFESIIASASESSWFIDTETIFSIAVIVTVIKTFIEIVANKTIANITIFSFTCVVTCSVITQSMFSTKIAVIKWISDISYSCNWIECTFVTVLTFDTITEETFDT